MIGIFQRGFTVNIPGNDSGGANKILLEIRQRDGRERGEGRGGGREGGTGRERGKEGETGRMRPWGRDPRNCDPTMHPRGRSVTQRVDTTLSGHMSLT